MRSKTAVRRCGSGQNDGRPATERQAGYRSGKTCRHLESQYCAAGQAGDVCKRQRQQRQPQRAAKLTVRTGLSRAAVSRPCGVSSYKRSGVDGTNTTQLAGTHLFGQHGNWRYQRRKDSDETEKNRKARPKAGALAG